MKPMITFVAIPRKSHPKKGTKFDSLWREIGLTYHTLDTPKTLDETVESVLDYLKTYSLDCSVRYDKYVASYHILLLYEIGFVDIIVGTNF